MLTIAIVAMAALPQESARSATPPPERLSVLFLGDRGHHQPETRCDDIAALLARQGIDLWFSTDLGLLGHAPKPWEDSNSWPPADRLKHVDVVLLYANHDALTPEQEKGLLDFVAAGKGLVAVHCASYCFRNSEKFLALVGGQFDHHATGDFTARTLAGKSDHPALRGVADFKTWDETYVHSHLTVDRPGFTLLQVRDEGDRVEPYTWVHEAPAASVASAAAADPIGKGRVYYTALGHDERTWRQPAFEAQLAQAIRWAACRPDFKFTPPKLAYADGKLPNYEPGKQWGVMGEPITKVQQPLSPADSRRLMQLVPGFDAQLFAAEPDVVKPIAISFDQRGRAWILESLDYPNDKAPVAADGSRQGHDRIKILDDADGDGHVDSVKLFAEGLNIPTGLVCTDDGCIVAQAPDMVRYFDRDGDDRVDAENGRKILFTGFGEGDTHAGPSSLRRGPDGKIWGTVGYSAFHGKVADDRGQLVEHDFGQAVFRFVEDGTSLERIAPTTNNTWGLGFDEEGEIFVSTANGDHLVHVAVPSPAIESIFGLVADGTVHVPDHDRIHPLMEIRQVDFHGGFTAAAGATIYTDRQFPPEYWNRCAFVCEPTGHLVHQCFLEPSGSTFVSHDGRNLVASQDDWFAPIAAELGPDGALWLLDWYTPVVQHNPTPRGFETGKGNAYETPLRDKGHGRIWRVWWKDKEPWRRADLERNYKAILGYHFPPNPWIQAIAERCRSVELPSDGSGVILPPFYSFNKPAPGPDIVPQDEHRRELRRSLLPGFESNYKSEIHDWDIDDLIYVAASAAAAEADRSLILAATIHLARDWPRTLPKLLGPARTSGKSGATSPAAHTDEDAVSLDNSGFSFFDQAAGATAALTTSWHFIQYSGAATGSHDSPGHAAAGSARLVSERGADASLSQSVKVEPHAHYRLSGWIKTEGVTPLGDAYGALFNVHELQNPRVVTPAVTGTHDWTKVEVELDSGDHESLTINCLLGGWGQARGSAWYDDLALERISGGSPLAELVRTIATHAAHESPFGAFSWVAQALPTSDPVLCRAALEGIVRGWPKGPVQPCELSPATIAGMQEGPKRLDASGRAALLLIAEKLGRLDLFASERESVCAELRATLADHAKPSADRADAARRLLSLAPPADVIPAITAELSALAEPELIRGLVAALGDSGDVSSDAAQASSRDQLIGEKLAPRVAYLSAATQPAAIELLLRRPAWTRALLAQIETKKLDAKAIAPDVLARLAGSAEPDIAALATKIAASLGQARNTDRAKLVETVLARLPPRGDPKHGAELFTQQCAKCHTIHGLAGAIGKVGPELSGIGKRGRADLLVEILDPNRSVEGTYRAWDVTLKNGDSLSGRMINEARATLEIVDAAATPHVIARDDIQNLRPLTRSLMPEGLEDLGDAALADLIEFLLEDAKQPVH